MNITLIKYSDWEKYLNVALLTFIQQLIGRPFLSVLD